MSKASIIGSHYLLCLQLSDGGINIYNLHKILFAADKFHLNKYGRPVTGDVYIAMEYGTVPSATRDLVSDFKSEDHFIFSREAPDMNLLSESDVEAINHGFKEYAGLTFSEVKEKNHEERCWKETERNRPIDFALIIENQEVLKDLEENGSNIAI